MAHIFRILSPLGKIIETPIHRAKSQRWLSLTKTACTGDQSLEAANQKHNWHIYSSVCLERPPVITKEMTKVEKAFQDCMFVMENENSKLSSHELRYLEDKRWAEMRKDEDYEETDADAVRITAEDDDDKWQLELKTITLADRTTDQENNTKSSNRKLDETVVLLVRQKFDKDEGWTLPLGLHKQRETIRQTAERVLKTTCGNKLNTTILGNAPCGFYKYKYPKTVRNEIGVEGGKVFFFKAYYEEGELEMSSEVSDYQWLTKDEMKQFVKPKYFKEVDRFVFDS